MERRRSRRVDAARANDSEIRIEAVDPDIFAAGTVLVNAAVQGTAAKPVINGRLQLQNASINII